MFSQILTPFTSNFRWHGDLWKAQNNFEEFTPFVKGVVTQFAKTTLLFILACIAIEVGAATLKGKVIGISDGDTVDVLDSSKTTHRIRLAGIDAPEKAQPFGQRSKEHLSDSVFGKQVEVHGGKIDKYGRTVGKILINGFDANLDVASRTIIRTLMKQAWLRIVPALHSLHWGFALQSRLG